MRDIAAADDRAELEILSWPATPSWLKAAAGPAILAFVYVGLYLWNRDKWFDLLIDFGRELYVPWRLSEGAVLYRDVAWFNGPVSVYFNAALFRLFGVSAATLLHANLVILGFFTLLLYALLRQVSNRLTATTAGVVFLSIFGFGHLDWRGNYSFVAPYSHEATHGLMLGFAALAALRRWSVRGSSRWLIGSGLLLGLCSLTKAEIFAAALAGCTVLLVLELRAKRRARRDLLRLVGAWLLALALPVAMAWTLLARAMPSSEALLGALGGWPWILRGQAASLFFYRRIAGLLNPVGNLMTMVMVAGAWLVAVAAAAGVALRVPPRSRRATLLAVAVSPLVAAGLLAAIGWRPWQGVARPLPLFLLIVGVALAWQVLRRHEGSEVTRVALAWCVFAFVLQLKILLASGLGGYGFVLSMPGALLMIVVLVECAPRWVERREGSGGLFRVLALTLVATTVLAHLVVAATWIRLKTVPVGRGADQFLVDQRGVVFRQALEEFQAIAREGETLAVFPEGVMMNYLSRVANPSRFINFMPPELAFFGEAEVVADLYANAPDYLMVTHRRTEEYGVSWFGVGYGGNLWRWIEDGFERVALYGDPPLQEGSRFGIELWRRRPGKLNGPL